MFKYFNQPQNLFFLIASFLCLLLVHSAHSQSVATKSEVENSKQTLARVESRMAPTSLARPRHATELTGKARDYYQTVWGVDGMDVKAAESGQMIRFSYTILDAKKAAQLNDKKVDPALIDEQAGVKLEIPTMEKVGQLRQTSTPELGKTYWMVFSNKGAIVKPGDRVTIVIGKFQVNGLYVR